MIEIKQRDRDFMFISMERYCLGRRSYAVGWCCDLLKRHIEEMSDNTLTVLLEDMARHAQYGHSFGMDMDKREWDQLRMEIFYEQDRRKAKKEKEQLRKRKSIRTRSEAHFGTRRVDGRRSAS